MIARRLFLWLLSALPLRSAFGATQAPIVSNIRNAPPWAAGTFKAGQRCTNGGQAYECVTPGISTAAPSGRGTTINNGGVAVFKWSSAVDYTSLGAWAAANRGTLARPIKAQLWNDVPGTAWDLTGAGTIDGITSSAGADVTITAAPGESFSDNPNRANHRLSFNPSYGVALTQRASYMPVLNITTGYLTISNLQVRNLGAGARQCQGIVLAALNATVANNILMDNGMHDSGPLSPTSLGGFRNQITMAIVNNLFVSPAKYGEGRGIIMTHVSNDSRIEQNTFVVPSNYTSSGGFAVGGAYNGSSMTIRNNAFFGFSSVFGYPPYGPRQVDGAPDGHNATDQSGFGVAGTSITVGNLTNVPFTAATFVQPSNAARSLDLRLARGSRLQRAGSGSTLSKVDIFGTARPAGAFDIGAFQLSQGMEQGVRLPYVAHADEVVGHRMPG